MRTFFSILVVLTFAIKLPGADTNVPTLLKIGTGEADKHYGQEMIVTGRVAQVTIRPTVTFMNLDQPYPDSPFTVVIFHGHSSFYGDANALKGKSIEIKGKVTSYHDKPEIALERADQLAVFDTNGVNITSTILQSTNRAPEKLQTPNAVPVPPATTTNSIPEIM